MFSIHNDTFHRQLAPVPIPRGAHWGFDGGLETSEPATLTPSPSQSSHEIPSHHYARRRRPRRNSIQFVHTRMVIRIPTSFILIEHSTHPNITSPNITHHNIHPCNTNISNNSHKHHDRPYEKLIADHQTKLHQPAGDFCGLRRTLKCRVLSLECSNFARNIRPRFCSVSHCHFLRVFITGVTVSCHVPVP